MLCGIAQARGQRCNQEVERRPNFCAGQLSAYVSASGAKPFRIRTRKNDFVFSRP